MECNIARPKGIRQQVEIAARDIKGKFVPEIFAGVFYELVKDIRSSNRQALGYEAPEVIITDGVVGRSANQVRPGGYSHMRWKVEEQFFEEIALILEVISPKGNTPWKTKDQKYYASHVLVVDGVVLTQRPYVAPDEWFEAYFVNVQPYARKLEHGLSSQRPNGVYERVAMPMIKRRIGGIYDVSFSYRQIDTMPVGEIQRLGERNKRSAAARLRRHPVIMIRQK